MPVQNTELWERLESWNLTPQGSELCFERKLAMDQGWTQGYAHHVMQEYKKFLYLTQTSDQWVCPSRDVDEAWHLHVTQTVDYHRFCEQVLGGYLHHHPSKEGAEERDKHQRMYAGTLQAYEAAFDQAADPAIWPSVEGRFARAPRAPDGGSVRRTIVLKNAFAALALAIGAGWLSAAAGLGHAFWSGIGGPLFLMVLFLSLCTLAALGLWQQRKGRIPFKALALDAYEVAFLEGGLGRMLGTASAQLIGRGALSLVPETLGKEGAISGALGHKTPGFDVQKLQTAHYVERTLYAALPDGLTKFDKLDAAGGQKMQWFEYETRMRLQDAGLALERDHISTRKALLAYSAIALIAVAVNRLVFGISQYQPFLFLVLLVLAGMVMLAVFIHSGVGQSNLGLLVLHTLKNDYGALRTDASLPSVRERLTKTGTGTMLALGFALFGTQAVMASTDFAGVNFMMDNRKDNNTGNSNSAGGCGGGGGGGCGGGCGGGGCGG